jgi:hypothetical protein
VSRRNTATLPPTAPADVSSGGGKEVGDEGSKKVDEGSKKVDDGADSGPVRAHSNSMDLAYSKLL